jgi:hypothetical protein
LPQKQSDKYSNIEKDPEVSRWLRNLRRGSPITAEVGLRRLGRVCELLSTDPKALVRDAKSDSKNFQDSLEDLVSRLEEDGKSPGYIVGILKTLRAWLRYNDVVLTRTIKVTNRNATPTIENEQIPTQPELSRILRTSSLRIRVAEALMAFADLRPETIGNFDGTDGLRLKDFPELKIQSGKVIFEKTPGMVIVRATLSKTRCKYITFLSEEGCTYLREYLEERIRNGESLTPETPLMGYERSKRSGDEFLSTRKITHYIRTAMRSAGVYKRPYVLRAYAETQLIIAESKGKISHPYLQFIAGHKGDIEARYSTNKGRLPEQMIEDMRTCYTDCEPFLGTATQPLEQTAIVKEAKLEALKSLAKSLLGIDLLEVKVAKEKEKGKPLSKDEEIALFEDEITKIRQVESDPQKIVAEEELQANLKDGWQFVSVLPSRKILIKKQESFAIGAV